MAKKKSKIIADFQYDAELADLYVTLTSGERYIYKWVPPKVYADFKAAPSKGRFFVKEIRDKYNTKRLPSDPKKIEELEPKKS